MNKKSLSELKYTRMEISYDSRYNIAYLKLRGKTKEVETIQLSEELNIDISPDGKIYGIEFLNANPPESSKGGCSSGQARQKRRGRQATKRIKKGQT